MRATIISRIYRPEPAAAALFLGAIADELLSNGHEVDVLTVEPPGSLQTETRGERIKTFPVLRNAMGYVRGILPYLSFDVPLAFRALFMRRPNIVLVEPPPTTGAVVRLVCGLRRIPYVYDAADIWSDAAQLERVPRLVIGILRGLERFALRGAAHIVTVSQGVADRIRELGVETPTTVSGFGADTRLFSYLVVDPEPLFVYAGSYSPAHGADVLVQAFARLLRTHPGYTLRFIGNGIEQPKLRALADELGISSSVEFLDPVPPSELLGHLGAAAASLATIKPGTVYEYSYASKAFSSLATGCPVLFAGPGPTNALITEANREVEAGIVCAYDIEEIADGMRELVDHRATSDARARLSEWAAERHSMAAVAQRVSTVLRASARSS